MRHPNKTPLTEEQKRWADEYAFMARWAMKDYWWAVQKLGYDDAFGVANVAVVLAARRYNPDKGDPINYIARAIKWNLSRACNIDGVIVGKPNMRYERPPKTVSLNKKVGPDSDIEFGDLGWLGYCPEKPRLECDEVDAIARAMRFLPPRRQLIVKRVVMDGATLQEVADELGLSNQRVQQLKDKALEHFARILRLTEAGVTCVA